MKKMKVALALILALAMLGACASQPAQPSASTTPTPETSPSAEVTPEATPEATPDEPTWPDLSGQTVIVYNCSIEEEIMVIGERFEEATGCKVESIRLSAGEALGRISVEKENPKADVWYIGGVDSYISAKNDGLLDQFQPEIATTLFAPQHLDPDGYYTGVTLAYLVVAYNETLLAEAGLEAPTSWQDLLDPAYKGQITMASPATSGTAYTFLSSMCQLYGEEQGMEYMKALDANVKSYEKSGSAPSRLCAQGEATIAITYFHDVTNYILQGFDDLNCVIPSEGTGYEMACTALIAGAPNPEAGKVFMEFALQAENQEVGQELGYHTGRTHPDATPSDMVAEMIADAPVIDYDAEWSGANRQRLIEVWGETVGQ